MAVKRFGPVLGAGVAIIEKEGDIQITPAPTGVTAMVGEFEKGTPGEPQFLAGKIDFQKRNGGLLQNSYAPQAGYDFFKLGRGAGELITWRVTAGDEVQAQLTLFTRQGIGAAPASGRSILGMLKAKSGGRWGGRRACYVDEHGGAGDLTATTLDTGDTMVENEWIGGTLDLKKVTTKTYRITGNTAAGVVSVEADQDLSTDWAAGSGTPANRYVLTRANGDYLGNDQQLAAEIGEGEENPSSEFSIVLYEDGQIVKTYSNLSTNPTRPNYWVKVINDDSSNYYVTAVDLYSGDKTVAAVRPANWYGQSKTLTSTTLTLDGPDVTVDSPTSANPTISITLGANVRSQLITGVVSNTGADMTWTTDLGPLEVLKASFTGVAADLGAELASITVTNGGTVLADGDKIYVRIIVLDNPAEVVGGKVWPDFVGSPNLYFVIDSATKTTVSVRVGLDLTDDGAISAGEVSKIQWAQEFGLGSDSSTVTDAHYLAAFDANSSTLNKIFGKNKGLVKVSTPGLCSTVVTKAGLEYAAARNYQFKVEAPVDKTDESAIIDYINTTIGRSDYGVCHWPSWGSILDPAATPGADDVPMIQIPLIGMVLGREALVAREYDGYHKAPAGVDVTLPDVLELPTGDSETAYVINEELTNPKGINLIKFRQGNVILWGDRTISPTSEWKWHHQRAIMSHYENILRENFDWIIFALNNLETQHRLGTSLRAYFFTEFQKGALFSEKSQFEGDAFVLKIDEENNTYLTRSNGDLNAEITLRIVDTVERLKIVVGKAGIFDSAD